MKDKLMYFAEGMLFLTATASFALVMYVVMALNNIPH